MYFERKNVDAEEREATLVGPAGIIPTSYERKNKNRLAQFRVCVERKEN